MSTFEKQTSHFDGDVKESHLYARCGMENLANLHPTRRTVLFSTKPAILILNTPRGVHWNLFEQSDASAFVVKFG